MSILVNGASREVVAGATVAELLRELGIDTTASGIAVAVNTDVVTRRRWSETLLAAGDRVEVIRATQGG